VKFELEIFLTSYLLNLLIKLPFKSKDILLLFSENIKEEFCITIISRFLKYSVVIEYIPYILASKDYPFFM